MGKTIIISNRLPVQLQIGNGTISAVPSVGGLATGMKSVHAGGDSLWIGWSGLTDEEIPKKLVSDIDKALAEHGSSKVNLNKEEVDGFYFGFSNRTIWPLFHYFLEYSEFELDSWNTYKEVNQKFADAILEKADDDDTIWVHDYQLMLVPQMVRARKTTKNCHRLSFCTSPSLHTKYSEHCPGVKKFWKGFWAQILSGFIPTIMNGIF